MSLQQMSSGLRKSTKSGFIAPLLPTNMENNNMDTDSFDTPKSYQTPGQRQEDIATDYDSDLDFDLNESTLVSTVSELKDYQTTDDDAIKKVNTLMLEQHRANGCERRKPNLTTLRVFYNWRRP